MAKEQGYEARDTCISAGMSIARVAESYKTGEGSPVMFAINILSRAEDKKVPHSELAMHVGAAGRNVLAWVLSRNYAHIIFEEDEGCGCGYTHGIPSEVLSPALIKETKEHWGPKE